MNQGTHFPDFRPAQADGLNPAQIFRRIGSRLGLLTVVTGIVFGGLAYVLFQLDPLYTASARIMLEAPSSPATNPLQQAALPAADREKVASEIQVVLSRGITEKVANEFDAAANPEFNVLLDRSIFGAFRVFLGESGSKAEVTANFAKRLNVFQVGTSRVIAIEFTSTSPELARDVANRVASLYIDDQRQASLAVNNRAEAWLSSQIETLRQRVADSEAKVEEFRGGNELLVGNGVQMQSQQLTEITTQLSAARAARADAEARVATLRRIAMATGEDSDAQSNSQVLQSLLIQQLRQQEAQVKRELTQLAADLLPSHPRMVQKQSELGTLEAQIRAEIEKVIENVRKEAEVAGLRQANAERELRRIEQRRAAADRDQIELRALERDAAANRSVLEAFLARFTEVSLRGDISIQETNARVISDAVIPEAPSFPRKGPMLVLAGLVSLIFGLGAVFTAEISNGAVRHISDIEFEAGVPVLATLPRAGGKRRLDHGPFVEGLRRLRLGLGVSPAGEQRGRVVAVTSTARGEGRTTTAIGLARMLAEGGLRVLLIDADFGNPGLARLLGIETTLGFRDLVAGKPVFDTVIAVDPQSHVHVMGAGAEYPYSIASSEQLRPVLLALAYAYDAVVMDCGPASSGDAQYLMRLADHCLYAVQWNATKRNRVAANLRHIAMARGRGRLGLGLVVTGANLSKVA
jgi:polysaccharide biosynthesis transport protein